MRNRKVEQAHRPDGWEPLGVVAAREDGEEREHAAGRPGPRRDARREVVAEVAGQDVDILVLVRDFGLPRVRPGLDPDPVDGDLGYAAARYAAAGCGAAGSPKVYIGIEDRYAYQSDDTRYSPIGLV
eukprot:764903-Hanusia_phi.AAC.2